METFKELRTVIYQADGISHLTYDRIPEKICFPSHWHDRLEFLYIRSGKIYLHVESEDLVAKEGQVVIFTPFMKHYGIAGETGVHYDVLTFDLQKFFNESKASQNYLKPLLDPAFTFNVISEHPQLIRAISELISILEAIPEHNPLRSMGKMYEIIGILYEYGIADTHTLNKPDEKFAEIIEYINMNFTENITTKDISKKFGYDNTYFCRRFKSLTGITTMQYIHMLRLKKAANLISTTNDNIKDIAWKCGFSDISHLSNSFKKHYRMSPAEYRKQTKH